MDFKMVLEGKRLILGVSGGIAAYKSVELLRLLQKGGADVFVVMTRNACRFVAPLTFAAISGHPVYTDMFEDAASEPMRHIDWSRDADAVVIAPATANVIAKLASGMADDPLTTLALAAKCPFVLCPAMNTRMYENRFVQANIDRLEEAGWVIVEPGEGELACGETGAGRLADPALIAGKLSDLFFPDDFAGQTVLVTAGPTREAIDPVRFITNHSSGKMGYAVARAAAARGARVFLVSGPTCLPDPLGVEVFRVQSAAQMASRVFELADSADVIIKAAAVADYTPASPAAQKIKKASGPMEIRLSRTTDILAELGRKKRPGQLLVGFAAETEELEANAVAKLKKKNLDMVCANLVGVPGSGFGADTNRIKIFFADGRAEELPMVEKSKAAHLILDHVAGLVS